VPMVGLAVGVPTQGVKSEAKITPVCESRPEGGWVTPSSNPHTRIKGGPKGGFLKKITKKPECKNPRFQPRQKVGERKQPTKTKNPQASGAFPLPKKRNCPPFFLFLGTQNKQRRGPPVNSPRFVEKIVKRGVRSRAGFGQSSEKTTLPVQWTTKNRHWGQNQRAVPIFFRR